MESKLVYAILVSTLLGAVLGFGLSYLILFPQIQDKTIHTSTLKWDPTTISKIPVEGYVRNWTTTKAIRILQVDVWMGNPYNITWEGDTFVSLNNTADLWDPPADTVLVHYQFDSHAPSALPHQRSFDLQPGFRVDAGETLYVYRLFNNFDEKDTTAGDGWVMLYYTLE